MDSITLSQYSRPLRIAFMVDKTSYLEAVRFNTALWGGIYNPIIPVLRSDIKTTKEQNIAKINQFDPDFVINLTKKDIPYIRNIVPNKPGMERYISRNEFYGKDKNGDFEINYGFTVRPVYKTIWEKEIKPSTQKTSNCLLIKEKDYKDWNIYLAFQFGSFLKELKPDLREMYKMGVNPTEFEFNAKKFDKEKLFDKPSPILVTNYDLETKNYGSWLSSYIVYVGSLKNWRDLVEFWNLRASGKAMLFLPIENYGDFSNTLKEFASEADFPINDTVRNEVEFFISKSIDETIFETFKQWLHGILPNGVGFQRFPINWKINPSRFGMQDIAVKTIENKASEEVLTLIDKKLTPFYLVGHTLALNSRVTHSHPRWATVINFSGYYGSEFTFTFPLDENVEETVVRDFIIGGTRDCRLSREGIINYRTWEKEMRHGNPLPPYIILQELFKTAGLSIQPSKPGIVTDNLINSVGGIRGCRLFKIEGVRRVIKEINLKDGLETSDILRIIGQGWKPEYDSLVLDFKLGRPLDNKKVLQHLIDAKIFRPGLKLSCSQCQIKKWYSISEIGEQFKCFYCQTIQDTPRLDKEYWHYQNTGLLIQEFGCVPVIISLWRFDHFDSFSNAQWHTSMIIKDEKNSKEWEVDYIYLVTERRGDFSLVLGEAKGQNDLKRDDFTKMKALANYFKKKPYLAFSTLKDNFSNREKGSLDKLLSAGYKVIPLTRQELDPYDLYDRFDKLPQKFAITLDDLAGNTQTLNLK